jgi:exodeoxyribonuclease-3
VIVSIINVNGVRAAIMRRSSESPGLLPWLAETAADVVCLQESRASDVGVERAAAYALRWSDHAPVTVESG